MDDWNSLSQAGSLARGGGDLLHQGGRSRPRVPAGQVPWYFGRSSDAFRLAAHPSQTLKFLNIRTVFELKLILSILYGVVATMKFDLRDPNSMVDHNSKVMVARPVVVVAQSPESG